MNWYYVDGPLRVGPLNETEWAKLVGTGKIQPETLVWNEDLTAWTPFREIPPEPEFNFGFERDDESLDEPDEPDEDEAETAIRNEESPEAFIERVQDRPYSVSTRRSIARGWELLRDHFVLLVGCTLLMSVIAVISVRVPGLDLLFAFGLEGVFTGGLFLIYLRLMRGEATGFSDFFAGFERRLLPRLLLKTFITSAISQILLSPGFIAAKMAGVNLSNPTIEGMTASLTTNPEGVLICLLVFLAGSLPVVYFSFCWMFAVPLIVDKDLNFWPAMRLSQRKVLQHPWKISVAVTAAGIVGCLGFCLVGVGVIFTIPIYFAATLYIYEDIFIAPDDSTDQEMVPNEPKRVQD